MWRSHMVVGASSWLSAQTLTGPLLGTPLDSTQVACGAVVAAGAALLCDMDTPASRLANTLGPATRLLARLIGRVFGGHRHGTHSLIFCAAVGALSTATLAQTEFVHVSGTVTLSVGELAAIAIAYLAAVLSIGGLLGLRGARAAALAALLVAGAASTVPPPALVSAAVTIGCGSHLLADVLTPEGIQPFWPFSARRVSLRVIRRTGDRRETLLVLMTALVTLAIAGGYA